ncbi:AAA family ATPase [Aetokthonos hydrillicola Thurmond2011]|jgi:MoxR-like ATPase|uniref:AAA family ATPase n=1 Tax=Aetokthonos hydrillicola Thurmond2011 TaxID=2712845 RepID=A0AAP5I430_9CYAN|nr:AAA family ATPase [Aetokthonos hydrillicola]MBO3459286.1 AAA family ATPase [Aetokthonos hydrillicola CCALA 1050]MBW4590596.1 AAA family ATPase [Aetokthonos hydrillicola CCALA 1050]MDR9894361.1 AAA family ATPase [Aetokthonos hydrillicola Thurmond2011]
MSDWKIFHGNQDPHDDIQRLLEIEAPGWRKFSGVSKQNQPIYEGEYWEELQKIAQGKVQDIERGKNFKIRQNQSEVVDAVNAALYLRRPLLVTGKPGSGKTTLAYAIAYELKLGSVLLWPITTRSNLQEGLYQYDAIARLQDAQLSQTDPQNLSYRDIGQYIQLGPLGTAFLPCQFPRVLLIDEIDKSDINLPNDLLNLLEEGKYPIRELERLAKQRNQEQQNNKVQIVQSYDGLEVKIYEGKVQCQAFPLIIMTSNGERDFPPAFLRRCVQVQMPEPTQEDLQEIVESHLGLEAVEQFKAIIAEFADKNETEEGNLATDQLLNTIYLLTQSADKKRITELLFNSLERGVGG